MKLNVSIEEISNGELYDDRDMVKIDTRGCQGCSACCRNVGQTIVLNPYDLKELMVATGLSYEVLHREGVIELHYEAKIPIVNMRMNPETSSCNLLDREGRCTIHANRPGICRLFPLGRYYTQDSFRYFYEPGECIMPNPSKIKLKNWINIDRYEENKAFLLTWHGLIKALRFRLKFERDEGALAKLHEIFIDGFYDVTWESRDDFYQQFKERLDRIKSALGIIL